MIRIVLLAALPVFVTAAFAQQEAPGTPVTADVAASAIPPGVYKGRVVLQGGTRNSEFELDLRQHPGKVAMWLASRPCNAFLPMSITAVKDGVVRLELIPVQTVGCERVFEVKVSGNELIGTSKSGGGVYDLKAAKQ